jgi:hypothetical protein
MYLALVTRQDADTVRMTAGSGLGSSGACILDRGNFAGLEVAGHRDFE